MKLYEILNQAKAAAEGRSIDQTWIELRREISKAPANVQDFLLVEYPHDASLQIWNRLVKQLLKPKTTARNRETKA